MYNSSLRDIQEEKEVLALLNCLFKAQNKLQLMIYKMLSELVEKSEYISRDKEIVRLRKIDIMTEVCVYLQIHNLTTINFNSTIIKI